MTTSNGWYISLGIAVISAASLFGATDSISPEKIRPGERAHLEVRLPDLPADTAPESVQIFDDLLMQNKKIQILEKSARVENNTFILSYDLTAYQAGEVTLPPIQLRYAADTVSTESRKLSVLTARTEEDTELRDSFGELRAPFPWPMAVRLLLIAIASYGVFFFLREWLSKVPWHRLRFRFTPKEVKENPLHWLKAQLQGLKQRIDAGEDDPQLIDEWSFILRTYYSKKLGIPVACFTTREILARKAADPFLPLFEESDRFRFSPERQGSAIELAVRCFTHTEKILCGK